MNIPGNLSGFIIARRNLSKLFVCDTEVNERITICRKQKQEERTKEDRPLSDKEIAQGEISI